MLQSFSLALKSIWGNKMRSFLTMLGIIIGVASVIILVSLVNGYMSYMTESFTSMGTNQLSVNLRWSPSRTLSTDDMYQFYEKNMDMYGQMSPTVNLSATVKKGSDTMDSTIVTGVSEDYLDLVSKKLSYGRFLSYADILSRSKTCVIGSYVAEQLFGSTDKALDGTVKINGYPFTVVGVVEVQDKDNFDDGGSDDFVYISYSCAVKLGRSRVSSYTFTVINMDETSEAKTKLENYLYTIYMDDTSYTVTSMSEMLDSLNEMITSMSAMLGGIAGISLLVAGVGVMNIMLVSVTERTREIGIRKSLGAKRGTIMQQFVIEAAVTSSIGGLIGIVLGGLLTTGIGKLISISATPTPEAVIISFSVSVGIGLIFGYMPASRAAKLNPIDALRSE